MLERNAHSKGLACYTMNLHLNITRHTLGQLANCEYLGTNIMVKCKKKKTKTLVDKNDRLILETAYVYDIGHCKYVMIIMVFYCPFDLILFYRLAVKLCKGIRHVLHALVVIIYKIKSITRIILQQCQGYHNKKNCERLITKLDDRVRQQ